ncbi:hypothetical protein PR048_013042 [Dryococelus australis]|uniref:Uncharacterized protein n=1 Tax=Dryococelus australis TaxID=614101 RepID=A0ABQ9HR27_9NEOP|nr:hypothetical protein PR048_013042 [Dryococelus australis]
MRLQCSVKIMTLFGTHSSQMPYTYSNQHESRIGLGSTLLYDNSTPKRRGENSWGQGGGEKVLRPLSPARLA